MDASRVLYPGSYVDVAPSFVWPSVTYVDVDRRAARFFADADGVQDIIAEHDPPMPDPEVVFVAGDYTAELGLADGGFDLLVSLYAGFVSEQCTRYLSVGGALLVSPSHGDAAMASIDDRYALRSVVVHRDGEYSIRDDELSSYLQPKKPADVSRESLHRSGRGVAYTRSPFAYLFERVR